MPLDTHRAFKRLQEDDVFTADQAERITETLDELDMAGATKEDLNDLEGRLTDRIERLNARNVRSNQPIGARVIQQREQKVERLECRIGKMEERLICWMIGGFSAVAIVIEFFLVVVVKTSGGA